MDEQDEITVCGTGPESLKAVARFPARYETRALLGEGGMGAVFHAYDLHMKRDVAIKVLSFQGSNLPEIQQRFLKEAKVLASIDHPNVVRLFSAGLNADGEVYQVIEYIEGESLAKHLKEKEKLSMEEFKVIFLQVLKGLEHLHEKGIVHRDIKPGNIMLSRTEQGELKAQIIDLGIARTLGSLDSNTLTQTNAILGSPSYMSPEQCRGQKAEASSDIYSLGCIMYEYIAGTPPFEGESALTIMQKHMYEPVPKLKHNRSNNGAKLISGLIQQSLLKNPGERPTASTLQSELETVLSKVDLSIDTFSNDQKDDKKGKIKLGLLALLSTAVISSLVLVVPDGRNTPVSSKTNRLKVTDRISLKRINSDIEAMAKSSGINAVKKQAECWTLQQQLDKIIQTSSKDRMCQFIALELKSRLYQISGEHKNALTHERKALDLCRNGDTSYTEAAKCNANLAQIYYQLKNYASSEKAANNVFSLQKSFQAHSAPQLLNEDFEQELQFITHETSRAYSVLASTQAMALNLKAAELNLQEQKKLIIKAHEWQALANAVCGISEIYQEKHRDADALRIMKDFVAELSQIKEPEGKQDSFAEAFLISANRLKKLDPALAKICCQRGLEMAEKIREPSYEKGTPENIRHELSALLAQL